MDTEKLSAKRFPFEKLLVAAALLVTVGAFVPFLITARYALPFADDFWYYNDFSKCTGDSVLSKAISLTVMFWSNFHGTFTSDIFESLLNPLRFAAYSSVLRAEMICLLLCSLAALALFQLALSVYCGIPSRYSVYFLALLLLPLLSYRIYTGAYLWFSGAMTYLLPACFMLLSLALLLFGGPSGKKWLVVFSCVLAFLMSGGSLEAAGLGTSVILFLCAVERLRTGKLSRAFGFVFLSALAGALLNTLAPGNYIRHSEYGGGLNIWGAAANSLRFTWQELIWLLGRTSFPAFLALSLLLGAQLRKRPSKAVAVCCVLGALIIPVITIFPVVLGYNMDGGEASNRCLFLLDAALIAAALTVTAIIGSWLGACERPGKRALRLTLGAIALSAAVFMGSVRDSIPVQITGNLRNGSIQNYSSEWRQIYDYVRGYGEGDVVVTIPAPEETVGCAVAGFTANPDNWQNFLLAEYFGVDSVRLSE